jgi:Glycosyl transferase family 2
MLSEVLSNSAVGKPNQSWRTRERWSSRMPKVTIVIPVHNREQLVKRAIRSCLGQTEADFEVNVVDDGSTDKTQEAVRCFDDPRIRLFTQSRNMGVGPARNRGVDEARGVWIAVLDSDDELVPDAVATIVRNAEENPDTDGFWFRCRLDDGSVSPSAVRCGYWIEGVKNRLEFFEACSGHSNEAVPVAKRSTFSHARYPANRGLEELYHLNFAAHFKGRMCSEILTLYHQDGGDRLTRRVQRFDTDEDRQFAADRASTLDEALTLYAEDMRCHAPSLYREVLARLLVLKLLFGDRRGALALMRPAVASGISMLRLGAIAGLGLISSGLLAFVRRTRQVLLARVRTQAG